MSQEYRPPGEPTSRTRAAVLAVWAGMTLGAVGLVLVFGRNTPWHDEWEFVPAVTGNEPFAPWVWKQHNEHRLPLPRAIYYGLVRTTGDFRSGMLLQVAIVSGLALASVRFLATVRGRAIWTDAAIPVALLHWGNAENFLMGYQINFALTVALACGLVMAARRNRPVAAGGLLLLLELTGGSGLPFVPSVGAWLLWRAMRERPRKAAVLVGVVLIAVAYIGAYFVGYERPHGHPPPNVEHPGRAARVTLQFLAMAFGIGVAVAWPMTGVAVAGLGGLTLAKWLGCREFGGFAVLLGAGGLALAVGVGRSGFDSPDMGLWARYGWLAWPVVFAALVAAADDVTRFGRWVPRSVAIATFAALPVNTAVGAGFAVGLSGWLGGLTADVRAGVPADEIVSRHVEGTGQEERARSGIPMLRAAKIGPFGESP